MRAPSVNLLALLLSLAAHLGLSLTLGGSAKAEKGLPAWASGARPAIQVYLTMADKAPARPSVPAFIMDSEKSGTHLSPIVPSVPSPSAADSVDQSTDLPDTATRTPDAEPALIPLLSLPEPRYFRPDELTEKPQLRQDVAPDRIMVLPDIAPQPVTAQLLINEQGEVEKVLLENSFLSEEAKRFVVESFANIKFQPGKLGNLPVRSQLSIEITLEHPMPKPVPTSVSIVH